uniref:Putative peptidase n=1 Tax=viral metagenome TaxID=1070528 RepID=A0A6H1ZFP0_9ZZZZ
MIWDHIKNFNREENWGNPDKINGALLLLLDKLREIIGHPIHINEGYNDKGHAEKSQHYLGNAVDFYIEGSPLKEAYELLKDALIELNVWHNVGLGIYPHWNNPGFHLDIRGEMSRWGRIKKNGKEEYVKFGEALEKA